MATVMAPINKQLQRKKKFRQLLEMCLGDFFLSLGNTNGLFSNSANQLLTSCSSTYISRLTSKNSSNDTECVCLTSYTALLISQKSPYDHRVVHFLATTRPITYSAFIVQTNNTIIMIYTTHKIFQG